MEPQTQSTFWSRNKTWIIILGVIVIIGLWWMSAYNNFVSKNEQITGQWAQVENQFQRRFDLIPNVVETVKGVAKQEQTVFGDIADARTRYAGAVTPDTVCSCFATPFTVSTTFGIKSKRL
jgi:hypothetical protein